MEQREKQQQAAAADMIVNHHYETRYNDPNFDRKLDLVTFSCDFYSTLKIGIMADNNNNNNNNNNNAADDNVND
jgi:hypothetical protein